MQKTIKNDKSSRQTVDEPKEIDTRKRTIRRTSRRNESEQEARDSENNEMIPSNTHTQTEEKDSDNTGTKRVRGIAAKKRGKEEDMKNAQTYELKAEIEVKVTERFGRMEITRNRARMNKKAEEMKDAKTYTATDDKSFNSKMNTEDIIDKTQRKSKTAKRTKAKHDDTGKYKPVRFSRPTQSPREMQKSEKRNVITTQPRKNKGENFQVVEFETMHEEAVGNEMNQARNIHFMGDAVMEQPVGN